MLLQVACLCYIRSNNAAIIQEERVMICRKRAIFNLLVTGAALFACCTFPTSVQAEILKIGGTGSALGAMKLLAAEYQKTHQKIIIQVVPSLGSSGGIKALLDGNIDIGLTSRQLTDEERQRGARNEEYATSPFVFITHPKVNKKNVTTLELEAILNNPEASWADGSRIRLVLRPENDVDTKMISSISPAIERAVKSALTRKRMIVANTDQDATKITVRTPGAFSFSTLSEVISENRSVNILSFNGVQPDAKNITGKFYPLFKSLCLVTTSKTGKEAQQFAEFVRSPAARKILIKNGHMVQKTK